MILPMSPPKKQKIVNIALCFAMIFVALGFCSANKGLYLDAICKALNEKRTVFSLSTSFRFITTSIVNIFFGSMVAKFGTKKLILAGLGFLIGCVLLESFANIVALFYVAEILSGVGFALTGTGMVGCVVNRWSPENKGTIMGFVLCANGAGGALAAQIISPMINNGDPFGYRNSYRLVAVLLAVLLVVFLLLFREKPKNALAQAPASGKKKRGQSWAGIPFRDALRKPCFYAALICIFFTGFCLQGITGIAPAHMKDTGLTPEFVATMSSISLLALTGSKFFIGVLFDKAGLRITITISCIASMVCMLALSMVSPDNSALAVVYAITSSIALPLETVMLPLYAADLFGDKSFDKIMGLFISVNTAGYAVGTPFVNLGFDITGSYRGVLLLTAGIMLVVTLSMQAVISAAHKIRKQTVTMEE